MGLEIILILLAAVAAVALKAQGGTVNDNGSTPPPAPEHWPIVDQIPSWFKYDALFKQYAGVYGVDWRWLKCIALNESLLGENARVKSGGVSYDGLSYGLMQLTFPTAGDLAGRDVTADDLNDPEFSIELAAKYIRKLSDQFQGDERKTIMSYNQGAGNTVKGNEYAAAYYDRWLRWFSQVDQYQ